MSEPRARAATHWSRAAPLALEDEEAPAQRSAAVEQAHRDQQADELVGVLLNRLNKMGAGDPSRAPEAIATGVSMYQRGFMDALMRAVPELAPELGARIEQTMCDPAARPAHLISLANAVDTMPELARQRSFTCIVERGSEDEVLWAALDAWRGAEMPASSVLAHLHKSARDERTLRRLADLEGAPSSLAEAGE